MSSCCGASRRWQGVGAGPRLPRSRGLPRESRLRAYGAGGRRVEPAANGCPQLEEGTERTCRMRVRRGRCRCCQWELRPSNQTRTAQCGCTCRNAAQTACARTEASLRGRMSVFERSSGSWMEGGSTWALASPAATLARNRPRRRLEKLQVCEKLYTVPQNCWKSGGQSCARAGELRAILYSSVARNSARGAA